MQTSNWAGNVTYGARRVHRPSSVPEVQALVAASGRIRALGSRHSFSHLADTEDDLVDLSGLPPVIDIDPAASTVTVAAGVRYGEVATRLHAAGYALPNLASLPHISVAGACATATHGSGVGNGNLATAVRALEVVTGTGDVVTVDRDADRDRFRATVVGLGALGIVTSLTLDIVPAFDVRQHVYEDLPFKRLETSFAEIAACAYSVSLFTDWAGERVNQIWVKQRVGDPDPDIPDARPASAPRHPIAGMPAGFCTEQLGVPGPWHERLPHFRIEFTPSSGEELQSEYFVPRTYAVPALAALQSVRDRVAPILHICEIRTVAADQLWLSPAYGRDSVAIHFTWVKNEPAVTAVLPMIEERLAPFRVRPHWGKLFTMDPEVLAGRYERLARFRSLREQYDPDGTFRNAFVDRYLA